MKKRIQAVLALVIIAMPVVVLAEQKEDDSSNEIVLEEVVVTATRSVENIKEIPAKVEVVDSQTIEQTVGETITEQLKKNLSIGVIEYPGTLAGIGIRGFRPEFSGITKHSLVLINGRPAGATNLVTILTKNIKRIEVLKGPASSLYGGEAMGGVVNIITTKNTDELTGMAEIGFGSFETSSQQMAIGGGVDERFDFDFSVRRFEQADNFKMGNGDTRAHTSYKTQNGILRVGTDLGTTWRVDLNSDFYQGRDIATPDDISKGDDVSRHKDIDRYGLDFTMGGELGDNNQLSLTVYKTNETSELYKHYTGWGPYTQVAPYQSYDSEIDWLGFQLKDEYNWDEHRFIAGIDYQDIDKESCSYNKHSIRKAPYSPNEGRTNIAGYLETIWKLINKRLIVTAGGRYDIFDVETKPTAYKTDFTPNSESFSTFSPRAGLNYLFDQGIRLHSTIGKAFVPPSAAQLAGYAETKVGEVTMITKGNSSLDPESSLTYDLGAGYDLARWGLSFDLTYFHTDVDDKISMMTKGTITTYQNSLSAEIDGLETILSFDIGAPFDWDRSLSFFVNSTHIFSAEEEQSGGTMQDIHNVAKYTVNYGVQYDDGMFDGKLNCRSQGRMKDTDWNVPGYPEIEYPSFTVIDFMIGMTFFENHRIILKADNLFDEDYYEKKGFPKPGRNFFVGYRYSF